MALSSVYLRNPRPRPAIKQILLFDPPHTQTAWLALCCPPTLFKNGAAMELRSLNYFVRIAELGSITRAAAHLHVAQPALTRHVQRLEEELNVALFTRANRGVRLTEAGQKLLDGATRILRDIEKPIIKQISYGPCVNFTNPFETVDVLDMQPLR